MISFSVTVTAVTTNTRPRKAFFSLLEPEFSWTSINCYHGFLTRSDRGVPSSLNEGRILGDPGADSSGEGKSKRAEKYGTKKTKERRSLLFFVPYFSARLDFPSPLLSAPGSLRMWRTRTLKNNFEWRQRFNHLMTIDFCHSRVRQFHSLRRSFNSQIRSSESDFIGLLA